MVLKYFKTVAEANKSPSHKDEGLLFPLSGQRSGFQPFLHLLLPPRARAKRNPRGAQESRMEWKNSLAKVSMPNYHSLISSFTRQQFKRKQSKEASETPQA